VNRLDQEDCKEARAHKGCRAIQQEKEEVLAEPGHTVYIIFILLHHIFKVAIADISETY
jgi:hypothetical protein